MISCGAFSGPERGIAERLVGVEIPSLVLDDCMRSSLDLAMFARACPIVLYLFPGCSGSPEGEEQVAVMDVVQHRAFRDLLPEFEARGSTPIGVSSQAEQDQRYASHANRLAHRLLCDPELRLAHALELPTFSCDGADWYQRLTLVVDEGCIVKVFYPIASAWNSAAQVLAWLMLHSRAPDGGNDAG